MHRCGGSASGTSAAVVEECSRQQTHRQIVCSTQKHGQMNHFHTIVDNKCHKTSVNNDDSDQCKGGHRSIERFSFRASNCVQPN